MIEVKYEVLPLDSEEIRDFNPRLGESIDADIESALVRKVNDEIVEVVFIDGGEPEDQTLRRDWSWVSKELNHVYEMGYRRGRLDYDAEEEWWAGYDAGKEDGLTEGYDDGYRDASAQEYYTGFVDGVDEERRGDAIE